MVTGVKISADIIVILTCELVCKVRVVAARNEILIIILHARSPPLGSLKQKVAGNYDKHMYEDFNSR